MHATLDGLSLGHRARIAAVRGDAVIAQRVLALGLLPGSMITVVGVAPMGDPITIESSAGRVSPRRREAAAIEVEADAERTSAAS